MKRLLSGLICLIVITGIFISPASAESTAYLSIVLPEEEDDTLAVGETLALTVEITPVSTGTVSITWTSDTPHIASVDEYGTVTALAAGEVTITAYVNDVSNAHDTLTLFITESSSGLPMTFAQQSGESSTVSVVVTDANGSDRDISVMTGATLQLIANVSPEEAAGQGVIWSIDAPAAPTSNDTVAEITPSGLLTGLAPGNAVVRATMQSNSAVSGTLAVTVTDSLMVNTLGLQDGITGVTVTAADNITVIGTEKPLQLTAAVEPAGSDQAVSWSVQSGDATIDADGLLTSGATEGSVTVCAASSTDPSVSGELTIQVVISYEYVLVINTNTNPTVSHSTGILNFAGTGASTQPDRTSQAYQPVSDIQGSSYVAGYNVDDRKTISGKSFICIGVGEHCYVWMEESLQAEYSAAGVLDTAAVEMIAVYQGRPYQALSALAGGELPSADGTGKLSILMENLSGSSGYYAGEDGITAIHIRSSAADDYTFGDLDAHAGLLAHEGQHALFQHYVCGDDAGREQPLRWLNEGLSVAVMDWVWGGDGNGDYGWLSTIANNDRIRCGESIMYTNYRQNSGLDYGLPYLFVRYLTDQAAQKYDPLPYLAKFYQTSLGNGTVETYLNSVIASLGLTGNATFIQALKNFYIASVVQAGSGVYGFYGDPVISKRVSYPIFDGASGVAYELPGTGALLMRTDRGVFVPPQEVSSDIHFLPFNAEDSASSWGGGLGTPDDPYEVNRSSILGAIALNPSGYYKLTEDIDLTDTTVFTIDSFSGTLNGNGHTISGVSAPLIYENSGTVCNLNVVLDMNGQYSGYIGGVVCQNNGIVRNVSVGGVFSGRLTGSNIFGYPVADALVGRNNGEIYECRADVVVNPALPANHVYIGQIAGWNCYRIINCIAAGSIAVNQSTQGGFNLYAGGLVGWLYSDFFVASLNTSYSITALNVQGSGNVCRVGRLVGCEQKHTFDNMVTGCYGLTGLSAAGATEAESSQKVLNDSACLRTEDQLRTPQTFTGWDTGIWRLVDGSYPSFAGAEDPAALTVSGAKNSYYIGEALDLTGATVTTTMGSTVSVTQDMLYSVPDLSVAGDHTVHGVYDAVAFSFPITVTVPTVTGLSVKTPGRSDYYAGWTFDASGVELTATIDGSSVTIVSGYTINKVGPLAENDREITYTYCGRTAVQQITVQPRAIQSIVRTSAPTKTAYVDGEQLSLAGLTLRLTYTDGTQVNGVTADSCEQYGIMLILRNDTSLAEACAVMTLSASANNGTRLYAYLGDTIPASLTGVFCEIMRLDVSNVAHMDDQVIVMHTGFRANVDPDEYVYSDYIEGGSSNNTVSLVSGSLPSGIRAILPGIGVDYFTFYGRATSAFDTTLRYKITDNDQEYTFYVSIRLMAVPLSDECNVLSATLGDVRCLIAEDTITVVLPQGQGLSGLTINALLSPGAKTDPSQWNGTRFDCSGGKTPTLTVYSQSNLDNAATGMHKTYTIHASIASGGTLPTPTRISRNGPLVTWETVPGATGYLVTLMRRNGDVEYGDLVTASIVSQAEFNMWFSIPQSGKYYITVCAVDNTGVYSPSLEATTSADLYYCNRTAVTAITVSGPSSVIAGGTVTYTVSVSPYDAGNPAVSWSVVNGTGAATITPSGLLTAVNPGTVTVRATADDGSGIVGTCTVTVLQSSATRVITVDVAGIDKPERALWIDGVSYGVANGLTVTGTQYSVELTNTTALTAVVYSLNSLTETDVHKVYPTNMTVWLLKYENNAYTVTRAAAFDHILRYAGSSIRITGNKGIRMITAIATDTKNALTGSGIHGYTVLEYGTAVAWASELGADSLVLGKSYTKRAYAFKKGVADPIYKQAGGLTQYTNVLVGFDIAKCSPDLAMRPYIILADSAGQSITLYGGVILRSIGYIAYQNRSAFQPNTASYDYIWSIIHGVYGNIYDADYKG